MGPLPCIELVLHVPWTVLYLHVVIVGYFPCVSICQFEPACSHAVGKPGLDHD